ncbi:MAG: alpha/beta hydrolase [Cyclobacteriaceae bacterium]
MKVFEENISDYIALVDDSKKKLHYFKTGQGSKTLILFHGFGQKGESLEVWRSPELADFTIYYFDLYYHGQSIRSNTPLSHEEWNEDFLQFLRQENITSYDLATFSLGGRFALSLIKDGRIKPRYCILVAPDGFIQSFYYRLASSKLFNPLFRFLMNNPAQFEKVLQLISTLGLASSGTIRFAKRELKDIENKKRVYKTWTFFKKLQIPRKELTSLLSKHSSVHLILGTKDVIIPARELSNKYKRLDQRQIHLLPSKHNELIKDSKSLIASLLLEENL